MEDYEQCAQEDARPLCHHQRTKAESGYASGNHLSLQQLHQLLQEQSGIQDQTLEPDKRPL